MQSIDPIELNSSSATRHERADSLDGTGQPKATCSPTSALVTKTAILGCGALSLRALCVDPADSTVIQFARYTVVGAVAFGCDFFMLFALTHFGHFHYLASAAVAFLAGLILNYVLSAAWVFPRRTLQNRALEFGIFAGVGVIGLGLNEISMWLLAGLAGLHYLWAKIATAGVVYIWNFGARKAALFR